MLRTIASRAEQFWSRLARPLNYLESATDWQVILRELRPLEGPFDWSLSCGRLARRVRGRTHLEPMGQLLFAWIHSDERARECVLLLLTYLLSRIESVTTIDVMADLPQGYESSLAISPARLLCATAPYRSRVDAGLWHCTRASAYSAGSPGASCNHLALRLTRPVTGQRVLLLDAVGHRPGVASDCVHRLRAAGAAWIGYLALANDTAFHD